MIGTSTRGSMIVGDGVDCVSVAAPPAPRQGLSSRLAVGSRDDWGTPAAVLERVRRIDAIDLDPCSAPGNPTGAAMFCHPAASEDSRRDGLALGGWHRAGLVYVNPPYSAMAAWAAKVANEAIGGAEVVTLVAARPDSRWFFRMVWDTAQAVCFWKGRLRFVGAASSAPFPSALVYHGPRPWAFEAAFADAGKVVRL